MIYNGLIKSVVFGFNDRGGFYLAITVDFEKGEQDFIMYGVTWLPRFPDLISNLLDSKINATFDKLVGVACRIKSENDVLISIGHLFRDKWIDNAPSNV